MMSPNQRRAGPGKLSRQHLLPLRGPTLIFHAPMDRNDHQRAVRTRGANGLHSRVHLQRRGDIIEGEESQSQSIDLANDRLIAGSNADQPNGSQGGLCLCHTIRGAILAVIVSQGEKGEAPLSEQICVC